MWLVGLVEMKSFNVDISLVQYIIILSVFIASDIYIWYDLHISYVTYLDAIRIVTYTVIAQDEVHPL